MFRGADAWGIQASSRLSRDSRQRRNFYSTLAWATRPRECAGHAENPREEGRREERGTQRGRYKDRAHRDAPAT